MRARRWAAWCRPGRACSRYRPASLRTSSRAARCAGSIEYSQARYAELLADYHKTVLSALSNVEDALVAVQQTAEQQRRQQEAADKARRAFDFAQLQMQAGTTNVLTVLNTETTLFTAQDALVQVKFAAPAGAGRSLSGPRRRLARWARRDEETLP